MPDLIPFHFETYEVRVQVGPDGIPWWVATDVCAILGLKNVGEAVERLKVGEKKQGETANQLIINEKWFYRGTHVASHEGTEPQSGSVATPLPGHGLAAPCSAQHGTGAWSRQQYPASGMGA